MLSPDVFAGSNLNFNQQRPEYTREYTELRVPVSERTIYRSCLRKPRALLFEDARVSDNLIAESRCRPFGRRRNSA